MTAFTVWKFDDPGGADHAASLLKDAESDRLVKILDHAVVSWPRGASKPKTEQRHEETWRGTGWGAFWGLLLGSLVLVPVIGGVAGAAIGAISKATEGVGISKEQLERIRTEVTEEPLHSSSSPRKETSTAWVSASMGCRASSSRRTSPTQNDRSCSKRSAATESHTQGRTQPDERSGPIRS